MASTSATNRSRLATLAALIAASASTLGSLYLSLGLGLIACPLCFYQRCFAMAVLAMLAVGYCSPARSFGQLNILALGPTVAGGVVAAVHTYFDAIGQQICPDGLFGIGKTAQQSLASYILIGIPLAIGVELDRRAGCTTRFAVLLAVVLGGTLAFACVIASPQPPFLAEHHPLMCYRPIPAAE
ncbi:disulfide bond formation protein B [Zavarzinella formosa]|uniref:disulfide bond formation protein B n=1 Tax=Zavarzinella formosa TaxID=360055 RepID=UPI000697C651|nr:disulfide bond formation protein B [Zavarzinella formosa]